jgi:hypothetical protein
MKRGLFAVEDLIDRGDCRALVEASALEEQRDRELVAQKPPIGCAAPALDSIGSGETSPESGGGRQITRIRGPAQPRGEGLHPRV